jgi:hypothetical protein
MYSEEYYLLIMDINTKAYLVLLIFLALSYNVSYATIPNVPDKLSVKISFPSFNQHRSQVLYTVQSIFKCDKIPLQVTTLIPLLSRIDKMILKEILIPSGNKTSASMQEIRDIHDHASETT